jgi:hypothetical protein
MPDTQREARTVDSVAVIEITQAQTEAAQRGALTLWTIYDKPTDYPHGVIARRHEVPGGPTNHMIIADLEFLRRVFHIAGLVCVARADEDDVKIVESWL